MKNDAKKKARLVGVTVLALFLLLALSISSAKAIPIIGNQFWGTVTVGGVPVRDNSIVSARIGGAEYKSCMTSGGNYMLVVPGDDPDTPAVKEGGVAGDTVEFYVAGVKAAETATFSIGGVTNLNLTVVDNTAPTVTLPAYTPDPTTDNTPTYSGTATDALTNVVDIEYRVDSGTWTDVSAFTPALSVSFTFTTPALADGTHTISVRARDNASNWSTPVSDTLTVTAAPPDFAISVSPTSGSAMQGGLAVATVSITSIEGFTNTVTLSASGLPSGATAGFSPSSGTPTFTSTLTISTALTTPAGTYTITITGTGGGKTHMCNFALTVTTVVVPGVPDFSIGVSPTSGSVVQGGAKTATVSVSPIEGFAESVSLSASGLPSGATATFSPSSGTPSFSSTLTISTSSTTPTGTYTITITGTGGGKTHACTYELIVMPAVPIPPDIIEVESPPVEIPVIDPDVPQDVTVKNTNITGLTIDTLVAVENVRIVVRQLTDRPATIAIGPPGFAYQYFNIVVENLSDAQIESVTIRFRVEKAWILRENINENTITLKRYNPENGEWVSLPTAKVDEDATYVYFSATSPGLSYFAVSGTAILPAPAAFTVSSLNINPSQVSVGEEVSISVTVKNTGGTVGTCTVTLKINGAVKAIENVTLAGGATELVVFTVAGDKEGTYSVEVNGLAGTFTVITPPIGLALPIGIVGAIAIISVSTAFYIRKMRQRLPGIKRVLGRLQLNQFTNGK